MNAPIRAAYEFLRSIANKFGLDIVRYEDKYRLDLYKRLFDANVLSRKPFYNVGAGDFSHPYWTNIDFLSEWYDNRKKDAIHYDLMSLEALPISDDTAEVVYTSHTIEHVTDEAAFNLFKEAFRALRSGGVLRVTTGPDAETDFAALMREDEDWFYWDKAYQKVGSFETIYHKPALDMSLEERWLHHVASALAVNDKSSSQIKYGPEDIKLAIKQKGFPEVLNFLCGKVQFDPLRPGNHISWWTHDKLISFLQRAGFSKIYRSGYKQSSCPLLRQSSLFDSTHPQISIYVEAIK